MSANLAAQFHRERADAILTDRGMAAFLARWGSADPNLAHPPTDEPAAGSVRPIPESGEPVATWEPAAIPQPYRPLRVEPIPATVDLAPVVTPYAAVAERDIAWLWRDRLPLGMLCLLAGDPGVGKSLLTVELAARVSRGQPLPDDPTEREPAGVVLLSAEDPDFVIRSRLAAAGADLGRVVTLQLQSPDGGTRDPELRTPDLAEVAAVVRRIGARLLILDPLNSYLPGGVDSHVDAAIRKALGPLTDFADATGAAVIAVMHLRKSAATAALYRPSGSIGYIAAARSALLVGRDPDDDARRIVAGLKSNLSEPPQSLAYGIVADPGDKAPHVTWHGTSPHSADALLAVPADADERSAVDDAADALRSILADGPLPAAEARRLARSAGIPDRTLDRAKAAAGVVSHRSGFGPGSAFTWALPDHRTPTEPIERQQNLLASYVNLGAQWSPDDDPASAWDAESEPS